MTLIRDKTGHYLGSSVVVFDDLVDPAILGGSCMLRGVSSGTRS